MFNNVVAKLDELIFKAINVKLKCKILTAFMYIITQIASGIGVTLITAILFFLPILKLRMASILLMVMLSLNTLIVQIIKRAVNRTRPYECELKINTYGIVMRDKSFPSGHTLSAITLAVVLGYYYPTYAYMFIISAILISISRIYLGVHYPTDVIFAMLIGFPLTYLELNIFYLLPEIIFNYIPCLK